MQQLLQDLRYGARMLLKNPGLTLIAVLTLSLGVGATTAIFSVVNGVLLRPLAYPEPQQIVRLFEKVDRVAMASDRAEVAPANFLDWQAQSRSFSDVAAYGSGNLPLSGDAEAEVVASAYVSPNLFSVLGTKPMAGRTFTIEEDNPRKEFVAVLGYGLWQRRFGGEPGAIGRTINLDGRGYTIIGVMPHGFQFPNKTELWTPLALNDNQVKMREARFLKVVARLKPDVSFAQAREEMKTIAAGLSQTYPQTNQNWSVNVVSLLEEEAGKVRPALLVLMGVVAFVLLMACANVANLLLARAAHRQGEMAIRLAIGATRARIVRQLLSESLILALLGGAGGALVAWWGIDALLKLASSNLPRAGEVQMDARVLGFALMASLLTGILFGLVPALQTSKPDLNESLKEGAGKTASGNRNRALNVLVVTEIALAIVVLAGAGLLINSFLRLRRVDSGLDAENVLTVKFTPPSAQYNDRERWKENRLGFYAQLLPRIQALPGVEAVGAIDSLPLSGGGRVYRFRKDGDDANVSAGPAAIFQVAMPDYFRAMGIPLRRGRLFGEADGENAPPVVVINETMARRFWPNEEAMGKRIVIRNQTAPREIIGVIGDIKHFGLDRTAEPEMYVPFNQMVIDLIPLVIRTSGDPVQIIAAVRQQVRAVDTAVAITKIQTMPQIVSVSLAARRFTVLLLGVFAAVALVLAVVGIYGVMSYSVAQRTREIGIRVALGAQGGDVLRLIVTRGMKLTLLGTGTGVLLTLALGRWLASSLSGLLFGVTANDPLTLVMIALLLAGAALAACWIPARRAMKVDPMIALRYE